MARDRDDDHDDWDRPQRKPWDRQDDDWDDYHDDDGHQPRRRRNPPANNLAFAIITTVLCCVPAGIVAIVYASQVESKWHRGDYEGAEQAAANAKLWSWISFGIVAAFLVVCFIAGFMNGLAGNQQGGQFKPR